MSSMTVRIANQGDEPYTDRYDNTSYTIPAGGDLFVPWDAVCLWLGDPRRKNLSPSRRERVEETDRLMARRGILSNDPAELVEKRPALKVFTTEGVEIPMLIENPEATAFDPFSASTMAEDPEERIYRLEQTLAAIASSPDAPAMQEALAKLGIGDVQGPNSVIAPAGTRARGGKQGAPPVDAPTRVKAGG